MPETLDKRVGLAAEILADPVAAHEVIFAHRHPDVSPPFHEELIKLYHSDDRNVLALIFRGGSKSTRLEEYGVLMAATGQARNVLIIGDSETRALERLSAMKHEFETNETLRYLCGELEGSAWAERRIMLKTGVVLSARGQGQSLRGIKALSDRPDLILIDDLESDDSVESPEAREKLWNWIFKALLPAGDIKRCKIRMTATPLHPESAAVRISRLPQFKTLVVPVEHVDALGRRVSAWEDRFPAPVIDELKSSYAAAGQMRSYMSEYMVEAIDPGAYMFKREYFKQTNVQRTWEPVFACIDPARTVKASSATTGVVVASKIGRKIIIWEAKGMRVPPSEVIDEVFRIDEKYEPIAIGVEKDGLELFIMEPLRHEQMRRGKLLPIRELKAPKGKDEFIGRLQPFLEHGDIIFACPDDQFNEVVRQFLAFPSGDVDIPNALAYFFHRQLVGGEPVYQASEKNFDPEVEYRPGPVTLAVNMGAEGSAAVLLQQQQGCLCILREWVGGTGSVDTVSDALAAVKLECGRSPSVIVPPFHFEVRNSFGLLAAFRGAAQVRKGGDPAAGREKVRQLVAEGTLGRPKFSVGPDASWTRRAILGGFAWDESRTTPRPSIYGVIMEAIEAAVAPLSYEDSSEQPVAFTPQGVAYKTAAVVKS